MKTYFITQLSSSDTNSSCFVLSDFYAVLSGRVKTTFPFTESSSISLFY